MAHEEQEVGNVERFFLKFSLAHREENRKMPIKKSKTIMNA
jgi:hypothetical protein